MVTRRGLWWTAVPMIALPFAAGPASAQGCGGEIGVTAPGDDHGGPPRLRRVVSGPATYCRHTAWGSPFGASSFGR